MYEDSTKGVLEVVRVGLFPSLHGKTTQIKLKWKLQIVIDLDSVHLFKIPVKSFKSYCKYIRKFPQECLA